MKTLRLLTLASIIGILSSCSASYPILSTDNAVGDKVGESSYKVILGFIITNDGDSSIRTAAKNGGITKISTIDREVEAGIFSMTYKTIVTGE